MTGTTTSSKCCEIDYTDIFLIKNPESFNETCDPLYDGNNFYSIVLAVSLTVSVIVILIIFILRRNEKKLQ